ncbi:MAG: hypothetical protein MUO54_14360, partial [Anaerolineales bacterium]|nr:hypothetical protein [Anaerolineales bacterium]
TMKTRFNWILILMIGGIFLSAANLNPAAPRLSPFIQAGDSAPPSRVVKLIFIHHSTGENWLSDGYGDLGQTLGENNYYVSDTNYGWGPDGIGDRTDIPDWTEWFSSDQTPIYMRALFSEGEQHADYARSLGDPGGENEIILFKSCFPNSDLEGNPDDPPSEDGWLSVGHAKYVYNEILGFFERHPEKLFIVITAPPLSDRSNAANARAFNQWLVNDWLEENDYAYNNVAVFDFYNVLTGNDGHHTFEDGQEIHEVANRDTLKYSSGDDHPSKNGSQKATEEFIPLLNYFYNRWQADSPAPLLGQAEENTGQQPGEAELDQPVVAAAELSGLIDNFEGEAPAETNGWEAYWDEGTQSSLACEVDSETGSSGSGLRLDYQLAAYSWGTCGLSYDNPQDWSDSRGLVFSIHSGQAGQVLHVDLYVDGPDGKESYLYELELTEEMSQDWVQIGIPWDAFQRVEWEAEAGSPFIKSDQVTGLALGFGTEDDELEGVLWIDELGWMEDGEASVEGSLDQEMGQDEEPEMEESGGVNLPCIGSLALPLGLAGAAVLQRKKVI